MNFCFIPATSDIDDDQLHVLAKRIEINAEHMASAWNIAPAAIEVFATKRRIPDDFIPIVFYRTVPDGHGALADHEWDYARKMPAGRVMMGMSSGILEGDWSVSESASHEVLEAMVNPECILWDLMPGRVIVPGTPGIEVAREVCDPCQDHYLVNEVKVANFVFPSWFRRDLAEPEAAAAFIAEGGKFDWLGRLPHAGAIGPEGYVILRDENRRWTESASGGMAARTKLGARDPLSRTEQLLAQAT